MESETDVLTRYTGKLYEVDLSLSLFEELNSNLQTEIDYDPHTKFKEPDYGPLISPIRFNLNSEEELNSQIINIKPNDNKKHYTQLIKSDHLNESKLNKYENSISRKHALAKKISPAAVNRILNGPPPNQNWSSMLQPVVPSNIPNLGVNTGARRLGATRPEDLPEFALPILEFMETVQPHIVVGCDRGGRLFGLAIHAAWRETRQGKPFPTLDGKLHFARISKSEEQTVLQEKIDEIVEASKLLGSQRGVEIPSGERLRVLFIDDWVIGGGTKLLAQNLMKQHDAETFFAVMSGGGADASGGINLNTHVSWHDKPEEIGVNYLSTVEKNTNGSVTQKLEVVAVRGLEAIRNRQMIQRAAKRLAVQRELAKTA